METVFVYGTLQKGGSNHPLLEIDETSENPSVKYLGKGKTQEKRPLVIASTLNVPFMLNKLGAGMQIYGELYEVTKEKLLALDELERHPIVYVRELIPVHKLNEDDTLSDTCVQAWCYILPDYKDYLLALPYLDRYNDEIASQAGKSYVPRTDPSRPSHELLHVQARR
ncbi:putative gamma-glutamylcyclotransferase CG2811 [Watersipora subatra]|uniref:putative gamma-glutamylcyclotransferase CG2811 n=1 Tax=Watersipora subatra TaxID=2589382 RepID=UPI00355B35F9